MTEEQTKIADVIVARIVDEITIAGNGKHGTVKIASVPEIITKINKVLEDDNITIFEIAELVQSDAALTARVLRVANSPLLCTQPLVSIKDAIHRLGVSMVKNLAVVAMLRDRFQARHPRLKYIVHDVAKDTAKVTTAMYIICKSYTELKPDVVVLMGLVHNIGKMVAISYINDSCNDAEIAAIDVEQVLQEINLQIGRFVLARWGIPPIIVDTVYTPDTSGYIALTDVRTYKQVFGAAKRYVNGDEATIQQLQPHIVAHRRDVDDFMRMFG